MVHVSTALVITTAEQIELLILLRTRYFIIFGL